MQKVWKRMPQWLRDTLMFILIMGCAVAVCELLSVCYDDNNPFATSVFILAVVLVSRFTTGYWPGILASAVGVVSVNYLFTYPFHEFNLTIDGYPLTFAVMLVVSVLVSTLTTQIKRQEQLRYEAERDRMRANLLRSVSHDIRTPLTAIMGLSATVEESETLTDEGRGMVEEIHQNAQWLLHLSENILSVTRFCDEGVVIENRTRSSRRSSAARSGAFAKLRYRHSHHGLKAGRDPARADGRHAHRAGAAQPVGECRQAQPVGNGGLHRDPCRGPPRLADRGRQRRRYPAAAARRAL